MSDDLEAQAPMSPAERFARRVYELQFRWPVIAAAEGITVEAVFQRLAHPEVQIQLERLNTTGEAAKPVVGPREIMEMLSEVVRLKFNEYKRMCPAGYTKDGDEYSTAQPKDWIALRIAAAKQIFEIERANVKRKKPQHATKGAAIKTVTSQIIDVTPSEARP